MSLKKILPMMIILFLICFDYSILRNVKDAVVITAKSSGAEVLPFIKFWVLLPMAVLSTVIFSKLSNHFSQEKVFYIVMTFFLLFFGIFTFIVYPYQEQLHPHQMADTLEVILPLGFKGFISMFRNWSFTLFYVVCELWGSIVISVSFWGFANEITKITEARRFYSMLGVVASFAGIMAGVVANYMTDALSWQHTLEVLVAMIIVCGCLAIATFYWMDVYVLNKAPSLESKADESAVKKEKQKISMRESFSYLSNSKYLICIAVLVLCYNLVINLVEIVWKDQLKQLYPSPIDYNRYMNYITSVVGIIATLTSLFMSKLINRLGWTRTALLTPLMMLATSVFFFAFMLFRHNLAEPIFLLTGTTPLVIAVFFGSLQVCLSKAFKYSAFDATKEMAFIPLSHECKLKGKAAIDGVGSRLGKSGGSLIHQGLFMVFSSVSLSAPYVATIVLFAILGWISGVRSLGAQFAAVIGEKGREDVGETDSTIKPLITPQLQTERS